MTRAYMPRSIVGATAIASVLLATILGGYTVIAHSEKLPSSVLLVDDKSGSVAVHVVFPVPEGAHPLMHYTEHVTWLNAVGGGRGADRHSNAWTTVHAVGYWLKRDKSDLHEMLNELSDVFAPIEVPADFAAQERDIVMREYETRMIGNPDAQAIEAMNAFLYAGNALAASVIGTTENIAALSYDEARALHAATHQPDRARLIVIGDVSERQVRHAMGVSGWPDMAADRPEVALPTFRLAESDTTTLQYPDRDAAPRLIWRRAVTLPAPVEFDLLEARTALLRDILSTNLAGGLAGPLRFNAAIARSFDVQIWPVAEDTIEISFTATPDRGVSLAELQVAFEANLAEAASAGIPEGTYSRVLNRFDGFWPDWDDESETARWMTDYVLDRVSTLRDPLSLRGLRRLRHGLALETTNALLCQLAEEGRTAVAFIGPEDTFE